MIYVNMARMITSSLARLWGIWLQSHFPDVGTSSEHSTIRTHKAIGKSERNSGRRLCRSTRWRHLVSWPCWMSNSKMQREGASQDSRHLLASIEGLERERFHSSPKHVVPAASCHTSLQKCWKPQSNCVMYWER